MYFRHILPTGQSCHTASAHRRPRSKRGKHPASHNTATEDGPKPPFAPAASKVWFEPNPEVLHLGTEQMQQVNGPELRAKAHPDWIDCLILLSQIGRPAFNHPSRHCSEQSGTLNMGSFVCSLMSRSGRSSFSSDTAAVADSRSPF